MHRHTDPLRSRTVNAVLFVVLLFACAKSLPNAHGLSCTSDDSCPNGSFCTRTAFGPLLPARRATCESCWQCCLLPEVYGASECRSRCRCAASKSCRLDSDCGPGEFCGVLASRSDPPTCQPCTACRNHSQAWRGSCAAACPSGALADSGVPEAGPQGQYFVFAAFGIAEQHDAAKGWRAMPGSGVIVVSEGALRLWLGDLPPYVFDVLISPLNYTVGVSASLPVQTTPTRVFLLREVTARLAAVAPSRDLMCPQLPPIVAAAKGAARAAANTSLVVPAGCPCNLSTAATGFRCPAGHRCSPSAWLSLPTDLITLGGMALLGARCVACEPGNHCPEGSSVGEAEERSNGVQGARLVLTAAGALDCPEGHFCPSPAEKYDCPAGNFCPTRAMINNTCDYLMYLSMLQGTSTSGAIQSRLVEDTIRRLTDDRKPLRGNYCPNNSPTPYQSCSVGHYCPDPSQELICPPGHFCRAESIAPLPCPPLTLCTKAGSAAPRIWPAAVATFCGLAFSVLLAGGVVVYIHNRDSSMAQTLPDEVDQDKWSSAARTMRRFIARFHDGQLPSVDRSVWKVTPHKLEVEKLKWTGPANRHATRPVLECVTGIFEPGHMSAILGPSGCGKSSLLALLAGRTMCWVNEGKVRLNDNREVTSPRELKHVAGFVPQDDILCADLTVEEMLEFSAKLRLPRLLSHKASSRIISRSASAPRPPGTQDIGPHGGINPSRMTRSLSEGATRGSVVMMQKQQGDVEDQGNGSHTKRDTHGRSSGPTFSAAKERQQLVEEVLGMLDLKLLRRQRVGSVSDRSLSGGQRKRVNIGVELVARPPVLLLDEPTSGLDAACSSDVLISLSDLAEERRVNVIMAVHQPRRAIYQLFSTVMLLDRKGRSVYHGSPHQAAAYFENLGYPPIPEYENVADRLLDIVSGKCISARHCSINLPVKASIRLLKEESTGASSSVTDVTWKSTTDGMPAVTPTMVHGTSTRTINVVPELSEELQEVIAREYDKILGYQGAAKDGGALSRQDLRLLLRNLGQSGPHVDDFVQGVLEETTSAMQQEQMQGQGRGQEEQEDQRFAASEGLNCDVGHPEVGGFSSTPQQQQERHHPQRSNLLPLQSQMSLRRRAANRLMPAADRLPPAASSASSRAAASGGVASPAAAAAAEVKVTCGELLNFLQKVQDGGMKVSDLKIRPSSSQVGTKPSGRADSMAGRVLSALEGSLQMASNLIQHASTAALSWRPPQRPTCPMDKRHLSRAAAPPVASCFSVFSLGLSLETTGDGMLGNTCDRNVRCHPSPGQPDASAFASQRSCGSPVIALTVAEASESAAAVVDIPVSPAAATAESRRQGSTSRHMAGPFDASQGTDVGQYSTASPHQSVPIGLRRHAVAPAEDTIVPAARCGRALLSDRQSACLAAMEGDMSATSTATAEGAPAAVGSSSFTMGGAGVESSSATQQSGQPPMLPKLSISVFANLSAQSLVIASNVECSTVPIAASKPKGGADTPPASVIGGGGGKSSGAGGSVQGLPTIDKDAQGDGRTRLQQEAVRQHPSWLTQLHTCAGRSMLQSSRAFWPSSMLEVGLLLAAAAAVGSNQGVQWGPTDVPGNALVAMMCLAVLAVVQHLRSFTTNRLVFHRERGAGLSTSAYFIARCLADVPWIIIAPIYFSLPYYVLTVPRAPYMPYYLVSVGVWWWSSGMSYLIMVAPLLPPDSAPTVAVMLTLIAGALLNGVSSPSLASVRGTAAEVLLGMSYNRWAVEALTIYELDHHLDSHSNVVAAMYHIKGICRVDVTVRGGGTDGRDASWQDALFSLISRDNNGTGSGPFLRGYCDDARRQALAVLFFLGLGLRVAACLLLAHATRIEQFVGGKREAVAECCRFCFSRLVSACRWLGAWCSLLAVRCRGAKRKARIAAAPDDDGGRITRPGRGEGCDDDSSDCGGGSRNEELQQQQQQAAECASAASCR